MGWDPGMDEAMTLGIKSHFFTPFVAKKLKSLYSPNLLPSFTI